MGGAEDSLTESAHVRVRPSVPVRTRRVMSSDRDGNEVETVYDRGDLNDWMVERWKSEQRKSTPTERPPERFRLGVASEPAASLQAPMQGPRKAPPQVRWPRGTAQAAAIAAGRSDEPMPRARGSSPVIPAP